MLVLPEQLELLQLEVQVHQRQLELLLLERQLVQLFRKPRLHIQCWRHMMIHSLVLLRSKLELEHCSRLEQLRSRLVLACSTLRGLACTSGLCT